MCGQSVVLSFFGETSRDTHTTLTACTYMYFLLTLYPLTN